LIKNRYGYSNQIFIHFWKLLFAKKNAVVKGIEIENQFKKKKKKNFIVLLPSLKVQTLS